MRHDVIGSNRNQHRIEDTSRDSRQIWVKASIANRRFAIQQSPKSKRQKKM